jgi:hypothetical protein
LNKDKVEKEENKKKHRAFWNKLIKIEYTGMKYIYPSKGLKHSIGPHKRNNYHHMLIPRLNDDGNVTGSCLMYCLAGYEMNPVQLKKGDAYKESF